MIAQYFFDSRYCKFPKRHILPRKNKDFIHIICINILCIFLPNEIFRKASKEDFANSRKRCIFAVSTDSET